MKSEGNWGSTLLAAACAIVTVLCSLSGPFTSSLAAQTYLYNRADFPLGTNPSAIAIADFNGDGSPDVAVTNENNVDCGPCDPGTVSILLAMSAGTFSSQTGFEIGFQPVALATADFNGDGKADLAGVNFADGTVSILLGNGDGTFQMHADYPAGANPTSIAVGDFNGDGRLDLAITNVNCPPVGNCAPGTISVLLGNGDGTFQAPMGFSVVPDARSVIAADLNHDGKLDLVLVFDDCGGSGCAQGGVSVFLGNGDGTFQPGVNYTAGIGAMYAAVADFNGDSKLDLAVVNEVDESVSILVGNGDGTFQAHRDFSLGVGSSGGPVAAADLNGYGKEDLVIANPSIGGVSVLIGNGDGTFQTPVNYIATGSTDAVALGDLNGDKRPDIALVNSSGTLTVLFGNGDGTFGPRPSALPAFPVSGATGDFNGDGKFDVVFSSGDLDYGAGSMTVLLSNGDGTFKPPVSSPYMGLNGFAFVAVGDFNGDGKLDVATTGTYDFSLLLGRGDGTFQAALTTQLPEEYQPRQVVSGDFNGDGKIDLAVLQANFGAQTTSSSVTTYLGNGDGTFLSGPQITVPDLAVQAVSGDFNHDGKPDLAIAINPQSLVILLGKGDGSFQSPISYPTSALPYSLVTADFNGDGRPDLAVAAGDNVDLFLGNGDGTFQPYKTYPAGPAVNSLVVGDFNGDGRLDLAGGNGEFGVGSVAVLIGNGDGTFQPFVEYPGSYALAAADFNSDGVSDFIARNGSNGLIFLSSPLPFFRPSSLNFPGTAVTSASPTQVLTLSNHGNQPLSITGIAATGDFTQTNTCSGKVAINASCTVAVSFTPTAAGPRTGTLTFTDSAATSPQVIPLAGTGTEPVASLSTMSLTFHTQNLGSSSLAQPVTLSNSGNAALAITSIALTGDFAQSNTCGTSVAAGANCTISVTFTPQGLGTRTATLTIEDNNNGVDDSTQTVALSGTGIGAVGSLSATNLNFGNVIVGGMSSTQTITLKNTGNAALSVTTIAASGDFTATNNCGASVAANGSCVISITFKPAARGSRTGTLTITDSAAGSPQTVVLAGSGEDFSLGIASGSSASASVSQGGMAMYTLSVGALGGLKQAISFTCTGAPSQSTCTVSPASITPGSNASKLRLTVTTGEPSAVLPLAPRIDAGRGKGALELFFAALLLMALGWGAHRRARLRPAMLRAGLVMMMSTLLLVLGLAACGGMGGSAGGAGSPGTPAGTYTLAVTGTVTSGATTLTHTVNLTLKVQ